MGEAWHGEVAINIGEPKLPILFNFFYDSRRFFTQPDEAHGKPFSFVI